MKLKSAFTMRQKALEVSTDSLLPGEDSNVHLVHWLADSFFSTGDSVRRAIGGFINYQGLA